MSTPDPDALVTKAARAVKRGADALHLRCPFCDHHASLHTRQPNGEYACRSLGCPCRLAETPEGALTSVKAHP